MPLDRRGFLRGGALTIAGLAGLTGADLVRPRVALAHEEDGLVSNLRLVRLQFDEPLPRNPQMRRCCWVHCYICHCSPGEGELLTPDGSSSHGVYRLNTGSEYRNRVTSGPLAEQLAATVQNAPFTDPARGFCPTLPVPTGETDAPPPWVYCYRLVTRRGDGTWEVCEWCSCYGYPENCVVIVVGGACLCYCVPRLPGGEPHDPHDPYDPTIPTDRTPDLTGYWERRSGNGSLDGDYYLTYNRTTGVASTATWRITLPQNPPRGLCRVEALIPGSTQPGLRTARAVYRVENSGFVGTREVPISQQLTRAQWVSLGEHPFRAGTWRVTLTDETGEPRSSRVLVADAVRWIPL